MRNWPIALGALSIIANLPPLRGLDAVLVLDRDVFPKLYTRDILVWNDPRILANQDPKIVAALANYRYAVSIPLFSLIAIRSSSFYEVTCRVRLA